MSSTKKTFIITGANAGLGFDASRQLGLRDDVGLIYLACRNLKKAEMAKLNLIKLGIAASKLKILPFDGSWSKEEIENSVDSVLAKSTKVDGIVLNAGGIGHDKEGKPTGPNHVLPIIQINLAAHVHLTDYLLKRGNLVKTESRVIFAGTEGSRGISLIGMASPKFTGDTKEYFNTYIDGSAYRVYDAMNVAYPESKGIATLYFSAWARAHPEVHVLTVSPGGTKGTEFANQEAMKPIFRLIFPVMMKIMGWLGKFHNLDVGAKRYVDAVLAEGEFANFKSGSFIASKRGVAGPVGDQVELFDTAKQYGDIKKQEAVFAAMNSYL